MLCISYWVTLDQPRLFLPVQILQFRIRIFFIINKLAKYSKELYPLCFS